MKKKKNNLIDRNFKTKVVRGISVLLVREAMIKAISVIGQLVLVRILAPEFFGAYAVIVFIVSIVELFTNLGLSAAIIQKKGKVTQEEISSIIIIRSLLGFLGVLLILICTPYLYKLYPILNNYQWWFIPLFSLTLLLKPVKNTVVSLLERDLEYNSIAKIDGWGIIVYYVVVILLAFLQFGVLSFIIAVLVKEFFELFIGIHYRHIRIYFKFEYKKIRQLINFALLLQAGNGLSFINSSLIPLVGGRLLNGDQLGYLVWSKNITSIPNALLDNYGRAAFTGIARIQEDLGLVSKAINKSIGLLNLFIFFFATMMLSYLYDFVHFIISDSWLPALPALAWFLAGSLLTGGTVALGQGLMAIGKVKELTIISTTITIVELTLAFILLQIVGFVGIAMAIFINACMQLIAFTALALKASLKLEYISQFFAMVFILLICYFFSFFLTSVFDTTFLFYILKLSFTAFLFWTLCWLLARNQVIEMLQLVKSIIKE